MYDGTISIRTKSGDERVSICRSEEPVWGLSWSVLQDTDVLTVADWHQKLSFYDLDGKQMGRDRDLGFDPTFLSHSPSGDFLLTGGSDKKVTLWTSEGIRLNVLTEAKGWIWCAKMKPGQNQVAVGCHDGTISTYQVTFHTVHGLYHDRYAFRQNMTDVVIQHLTTDQRARIKCRDFVKKIAVYKDKLAVQLSDRIIVYELLPDEMGEMHYRIREKIPQNLECNLLVVTAQHLILCLDKKLHMYNFHGELEREWALETVIRYIKVTGGPAGREGILLGLKSGEILQIFLDNPFPISLLKQSNSIRCLDLSMGRTKVAIVDDQNTCLVYDLATKELLYSEPHANSVAWNTDFDDMLCYSGNGSLNIKVSNFPAYQQKLTGFVVGFKGSRLFCLNVYAMSTVDVPQSSSMDRYIERRDFDSAYRVACLGATQGDWKRLAMDALEHSSLIVAKKSFTRIKDLKFFEIIRQMERVKDKGDTELIWAEALALAGRYHEVRLQ